MWFPGTEGLPEELTPEMNQACAARIVLTRLTTRNEPADMKSFFARGAPKRLGGP